MTDNIVAIDSKEDKQIKEISTYLAKLHRAMYDAHIKAGFEHEDALYLCCSGDQ
jgi:hypothetical protein